MIPPCNLVERNGRPNWCNSGCRRHHDGHYREYALDPGEKGQKFRSYWRAIAANHDGHIDEPLPGIATRARNYLSTLAEHVSSGSKICPLSVIEHRRAICKPCSHRNRQYDSCAICGCPVDTEKESKIHWAVSRCPVNNWNAYTLPYDDESRHLLFHIWPRRTHAGTWQRNLDQLKTRWKMFTGRRVIAIVTSHDSHPAQAVKEYMHGYDCDYYETENDPNLREVKTFDYLFGSIENYPGYTFYAQAKGVTKPIDPGVTIHAWTTAMYETLLDYWPLVRETLQKYPVAGSFLKHIQGNPGAFEGSTSQWHYSGSFCWFNNRHHWRRNWKAIERVWFGIESYPSMVYDHSEAGVIFHHSNRQFDLYSQAGWSEIEAKLRNWRARNAKHRIAA